LYPSGAVPVWSVSDGGNTSLSVSVLESLDVHTLLKKVLIVLQWVVSWVEVLIWRSVSLLERCVGDTLGKVGLHLSSEVPLGEEAIGWNPMVVLSGLISPGVLEAGGVRVREVEWHISESIIDGIALLTLEELLQVVLDNWALSVGSMLSSSDLSLDAVTEGKDVLESGMLKSVWVHVNKSGVISDSTIQKSLVWDGSWVDASGREWLLHDASIINILEGGDLLSMGVLADLDHLPAEADIDASLVALVKSDLVGVWELVDLLIWGEVLDSSVGGGSSLELILSQEGFIVQGVEISSLSLVWELWRVADHVTVIVVPSVIVVSVNSQLVVEHVDENILLLWGLLKFWKSLDEIVSVIESWGKDKSLVGVFPTVGKNNLVLGWKIFYDLGTNVSS
jgi:hypothetical protein